MKTWIGIGVVIGLALIIGLGSILFRNLGGDLGGDSAVLLTSDLARQGYQVAVDQGCVACHTLDGSPGIGPSWKGMFGRMESLADGSTVIVDEAYIRESILDPGAKLVMDYQNVMLEYPLPNAQLDALIEFTRQLR